MGAHDGKVMIVTGGARGIGEGIVRRFAADGASVLVADVDADAAAAVAAELGTSAAAVRCDVTDEGDLEATVQAALDRFGRLDVMVNNAGVVHVAPLVDTTVADWDRIFAINVRGMFLGSRAAARALIAQGDGGVIVNAASGAGRHGVPAFSHYCATKAAAIVMSQALALELAPHRIRVNCYAPGHTVTPLWDTIAERYGALTGATREETLERFLGTIPWGRFGTPADVAATVSWLCTDDAEYVTAQTIAMNGGELVG
jgi:NAD(P)-dependent dehydrogenase (short-subunit alcohol dehydrogenase family)